MKVENMRHATSGRVVPNQLIITSEGRGANGDYKSKKVFQSYDSVIAVITHWPDVTRVELDERFLGLFQHNWPLPKSISQ